MKVSAGKKSIDSFFPKLSSHKSVSKSKENEGSAAEAAALLPDEPSPSEPHALHATKRRRSSNGSAEPLLQSSRDKRQCVPSSEPRSSSPMVDLTRQDGEGKQQEMQGSVQPELQQEQQLQQQGSEGEGTAAQHHGIEGPTFPREKGYQGQEAHQYAVRAPADGAPDQELQQQGSGYGCSGAPLPPLEASPASHHSKRRNSHSTAATPSTPTATTNSSGKQGNGASSRDRQDGQEQAHGGASPPEEQRMSAPQDTDAAASETKNTLQDRPQLLADVQQQIQDVRAALGQELLLPCPLSQEPHRADQQAAAAAVDQGHPSLQLAEVAAFVEGRRCTLSALVEQLLGGIQRQQQPASEDKVAAADAPKSSAWTIAEGLPERHKRQSNQGEGAAHVDAGGGGGATSSSSSHSSEAVGRMRTQLVDLAMRKSYATKDAVQCGLLDAAEDMNPDAFWFWELREPKKALMPQQQQQQQQQPSGAGPQPAGGASRGASVPRNSAAATNKKLTDLYRRRRKDLHDRLAAATNLVALLQKTLECSAQQPSPATQEATPAAAGKKEGGKRGQGPGKVRGVSKALEEKLGKAVQRLEKLPSVDQIELALESGLTDLGSRDGAASRRAERADAAQREQERAAAAAAKEEEKRAKAAEKNAKAAGFSNVKELQKSKQVFKSFFKPGPSSQTPAPHSKRHSLGATSATPPSASQPQRHVRPNSTSPTTNGPHTATKCGPSAAEGAVGASGVGLQFMEEEGAAAAAMVAVLPPCPSLPPSCNEGPSYEQVLDERRAALDASNKAGLCTQDMAALRAELCASWKHEAATQRMRVPGEPPSWARHPHAPRLSLHARCVALWGEGYDASAVQTRRKKLLKHHDDRRPAYYGSWSRISPVVSGRRPFGRDPGLDYEVMSDEEWEEEPEGESLSDDNDGEEMSVDGGNGGQGGNEDGEEAEGFVVEDGFLSEDEGAREMDEDAAEGVCDAGPSATHRAPPADPLLAALESGIARALRSNKPLIVSRLPLLSNSGTQAAQPAQQHQYQQQHHHRQHQQHQQGAQQDSISHQQQHQHQQGVQQDVVSHQQQHHQQQQQQHQQRAQGSDTAIGAGAASLAAGLGGAPSTAAPPGQDPEVLLGALCGSVLRPGTLITPPLERSIYAPRVPPGPKAGGTGEAALQHLPHPTAQGLPLGASGSAAAGAAAAAAGAGSKNGLLSTSSAVADPALLQDVLGHMEAAGLESAAGAVVQQAITAAAATGGGAKGKGTITGLASHPQGLNCSGNGNGSGAGGAGSGVGGAAAGCTANTAGGSGGAARGGGRPPASFPEAAVPALAAFLQSTSERSLGKVVDGFQAAYSSGSLALLWGCVGAAPPKRTIKDKIKEVASYQIGTKSWAIAAGVPTTPTPLAQPQLPPALVEHAHSQQQAHLQQQQQQQQQKQQQQAHVHQRALPVSPKPPALRQSVLPATSPTAPAPAPTMLPATSSPPAAPRAATTPPAMPPSTSQAALAPAPVLALGASLTTQRNTPDAIPQAPPSQAPLPQQQPTLHAQHTATPSAPSLHETSPQGSQARPEKSSVPRGASAPAQEHTPEVPQAAASLEQGSQALPESAAAAPTALGQSAEALQAPASETPQPPLPMTSSPTTAAAVVVPSSVMPPPTTTTTTATSATSAAAGAAACDAEARIELPESLEPATKCRRVEEFEAREKV